MRLNYEISTNSGLFLRSLAAAIKGYGNWITNVADVVFCYNWIDILILIYESIYSSIRKKDDLSTFQVFILLNIKESYLN